MELHTCLWNDVDAFNFTARDLAPIRTNFPHLKIVCHQDVEGFPGSAGNAEYLLTWEFQSSWYQSCPALRAIFTPAAGSDWVEQDPRGRVELIQGTFHGDILGESLLSAILFMNHRMPDMIRNFQRHAWNRNLQQDCKLLRNQVVLIVGLGHIGSKCARLLQGPGMRVIGIKRDPSRQLASLPGVELRPVSELDSCLGEADHVVLLLPGGNSTDRLFDLQRLLRCKKGAYIYNFGRGNAIVSADLVAAKEHIGGAFLDVVEEEPLDPGSPLWAMENVMITPHSSCVYREYKGAFISEVVDHLRARLS
jgi:phosphoglycerate dehydrogenase-like enzyme